MADQNFPDNTIYELDNLDVLRGMNSETVDLIATDPPFNTKRNRSGTAGFYVDNWKWGDTGVLPDQWAWNEVHPIWMEEIRDDNRALYEVIEAAQHCHGQDIAAFLCFLSVRLLAMHRVLKPTGSLYLHCDHTANAYIRMALDAIFRPKNFKNEVVWAYKFGARGKKSFGRKHDTIFYYSKTASATFNEKEVRVEHEAESLRLNFRKVDENGRLYREGTWKSGKTYRYYADEGRSCDDVWADINSLHQADTERTGSPDQKPLALYERIVLASSNPGDLVLDPFAGCATTIMAARKHRRRWVGIDRRPDARFHVVCRMMGIRAKDAEELRQRPDLADWLNNQLAQHESCFRTDPPVRTDEGGTAAPFLGPVYTTTEKSILTHRQMKDFLIHTFELQCWGCDFQAPDERYLQLDHVDPKADGGSNHLDNRALLCQPCNQAKSNKLTLGALRRENIKQGHLTKPPGTKRGQDGHPINLPQARQLCRDALNRHKAGQPLQPEMML